MTMQDIINVLTVVREGSFSRAAERLYVSQSAISQSIARLEAELGVALFVRTTRAVTPTREGRLFAEKGAAVEDAYNRFCADMKQMARPDRRGLRIGVTSFFSRYLGFQKEVHSNREKYPFDVELVEDSSLALEQMLLSGALDFAFVRAPLAAGTLQWEPLFSEQLLLMVPASHPACREIPSTQENPFPAVELERFKNAPFVMISNARITSNCINMCQEAGFMPRIAASTQTWERIYNHVTELELVGFISRLFAKPDDPRSPVRYFSIPSQHASLEHIVAYRAKDALSRNGRIYIDAAREFLRQQTGTQ